MNLKELEDFKLTNAVQFHNVLNPVLFRDEHMIPAVRNRLLEIADDFMEHLGVSNIDVKDITLSGSNASYTYTPHSDIDLHILVDIKKLDNDEIYAELFHVKKIIWNLQHDITIGGYEVELYVQDSAQPVISRGEYSVLNDRWIKFPTKRVADINEPASKSKFEKLVQVAELALKARDMDKIEAILDTIRKYRKAGLESQGEFSPENIAFKAFRTSGLLHRLRDVYNEIHSEKMSMEQKVGKNIEQPVYTISELAKMHGCSRNDIISELKRGIKFEMANTSVRSLATEMAYKNLANNAKHYSKLRDDYDPNGVPPGPEFKPTMPKGTVRVDVSDVYDWYKLGQHISNMKGLGKHDFGKGPPSTILSFGDEDTEHKYIDDLEKTGLTTTDIDPIDPNQPKGMKKQKVDPTFNVGVAEGSSEKVNVQAHRNGDTVWIDYFEVTPKKQGYGTKIYQEWENSLPADVKVIKLIASDAGDGPSDKFWDQMGFDYVYDDDDGPIEMIKYLHQAKQRVAEGATVTRIDSKPITDFASNLKTYRHTDDWSQSGLDTGDDSYWKNKNLKTKTTKGLFAGDARRTALYATGNANETRYVEFTQNGKPIVYFDRKDLPAMRSRKTYLTVFNAANFRKLPTGEWFSKNPGNFIKQIPIGDPFKYIADQGWTIHVTDDLNKVFKQVKKMHQAGKIDQYGAEGMNESKQRVAEGLGTSIKESSGYIPSEAEKDDPRFSTALTVDIKPDSIRQNAIKLGLGEIKRSGIPPIAKPSGKF